MDLLGHQALWSDMVGRRPAMETNSVRNPDAPMQMVSPASHSHQSDSVLDGEKTGATLFFTGAFLTLVGAIFTVTGWHHYFTKSIFEWIQLLGPILISVGGTFIATSVCKYRIISCWPCKKQDEEVPAMEQTSAGQSFTLSCINQPVMFCGTTTMLCIPPVYNFPNQEAHHAIDFQPGGSLNGVHAPIPSYESVCCADNAAFTADDSAHGTGRDGRRGRTAMTETERRLDSGGGSSTSPAPPAYEDIFPSYSRHNQT